MKINRVVLRLVAVVILCLLVTSQASPVHAQSHEEVVLWESIKDSNRISDYQGYLDKYPNGTFSSIARRRIDEINAHDAAANTVRVQLMRLGNRFLFKDRKGTLAITPSRITWSQYEHTEENFDAACGEVPASWDPSGLLVLWVDKKKAFFRWENGATYTELIRGLREVCKTDLPDLK